MTDLEVICDLKETVARLEERLSASDKALIIAKEVTTARELGASANIRSQHAMWLVLLGIAADILVKIYGH